MKRNPREFLLSHRLRGFSPNEASLSALRAGLSAGVRYIEVDTRITADGEVLVFHESRLDGITDRRGRVADYDLERSGRPRFRADSGEEVATLEEFVAEFTRLRDQATLLVDLKDGGAERRHCEILAAHGLERDSWIISWFPDVLVRIHRICPGLRLSFSHVPLTRWRRLLAPLVPVVEKLGLVRALGRLGSLCGIRQSLRDSHLFLGAPAGAQEAPAAAAGLFPIHFLADLPDGTLGEALRASRGAVSVPSRLITRAYVERAHQAGLRVLAFTLDAPGEIEEAMEELGPDIIFTDNAELFTSEWQGAAG